MSVHTELFEDSVSYLKKSDGNGHNLYDHLSETLLRILEERPSDPVDKFEFLSVEVKRGAYTPDAPHTSANVLQDNSDAVMWANGVNKLFEKVEPQPDEDTPTVANTAFELEDCMASAGMLEWAGVSVGREELYRLVLSMKKMCSNTKTIKSARLWGKILGKSADYYVMETTRAETEDGDAAEDAAPAEGVAPEKIPEKPGTGCNYYVYYVCNFAGGEWVALPDVEPEQIIASRALRRYFTGNLDARVMGYPPFPGGDRATEKNLLRAQIARITASTSIAPAGFFKKSAGDADEDNEDAAPATDKPLGEKNKAFGTVDEEGNEIEGVTGKELCDPEKWEYTFPFILPMGRVLAPAKPEAEDDEEPAEDTDDSVEKSEKFTTVAVGDEKNTEDYPKGLPQWNFSLSSDLTPEHAPVVGRSLLWPGAVSVFLGQNLTNFYVGYGTKHLSGMEYTPLPPTDIQTEFEHEPLEEVPEGEEPEDPPKKKSLAIEQIDPLWEEEEKKREAAEEAREAAAAAAAAEDGED